MRKILFFNTKEEEALAPWLSAALEDDNVCIEFKNTINNWFNSHTISIKEPSEEMREIERKMWESLGDKPNEI